MNTTIISAKNTTWSFPQGKKWITTIWQRSFSDWRYRLLLHTGFWIFLLFFWLRESLIVHIEPIQTFSITFTGIVLSLSLFYPLVYGFIPLLRHRRWIAAFLFFIAYYILAILLRTYHISLLVEHYKESGGWFAGQDFWSNFYKNQLQPYRLLTGFFSSITGLISIIYISLTLKFLRYAYRSQLQKTQLEKDNIQLELNFLKAQINPHLLFNSLNNLQSYIVHDEKEKSIELLNRLAGLLRFSLYEGHGEFVTLQQETTLLKNYIAVESIRYDEKSEINTAINDGSLSFMLPALLLMPLVENAFKYSADLAEANLHLRLSTENDILHLFISNSYVRVNRVDGGIGLQNVRKRLQHYFPGRHLLKIEDKKNVFTVDLTIYPPAYAMHHR